MAVLKDVVPNWGEDFRGLASQAPDIVGVNIGDVSENVGPMVDAMDSALDSDASDMFNDNLDDRQFDGMDSMEQLAGQPIIISTVGREEYNADTSPNKDLGMYHVEEGLLQQMIINSPLDKNSDSDAFYGG